MHDSLGLIVGKLLVIGLLLWGLFKLPFIEGTVKTIIWVLVVVGTGLWLLHDIGGVNTGFERLWP